MPTLRTYVAPLLTSTRKPICRNGVPVCWLDDLLEGGIHAPADLGRPLIVLICGPPGAGKSLLLQQLAFSPAVARHAERRTSTLIISTEVGSKALIDNISSLGMTESDPRRPNNRLIWGHDYKYDPEHPLALVRELPEPPGPPVILLGSKPSNQSWAYNTLIDHVEGAWKQIGQKYQPETLAIDSLNVLSEHVERKKERERYKSNQNTEMEREDETEWNSRDALYNRIVGLSQPPRYLFLVLDTPSTSSLLPSAYHQFWEYTSDVIIRMDYGHGTDEYFMRHMEVVKARFQAFALGRQLIKIFRNPGHSDTECLTKDPEGPIPNIERGGVFVFPSEHFILSKIRSGNPLIDAPAPAIETATQPAPPEAPSGMKPFGPGPSLDPTRAVNWPVPWCYEMVGSGIPRSQVTALVGKRGLHKSYFGYQFLLDGVANGEDVCVLSFRDNAVGVQRTLQAIMTAKQYQGSQLNERVIRDKVHVVYQRPGYVTPQELLHRVITAVGEYRPTRLLVNAVDQWAAGHPLLAGSSILLPCLIDFVNTQNVTSLIVGVEDDGLVRTQGLTSKAEVVLSFEYRELPWTRSQFGSRKSQGEAVDGYPAGVEMRTPPDSHTNERAGVVVLRAVRVPHGAAGLARGVLEYEAADDGSPAGLKMLPLAPEYPMER